jgi:serine/threonine-protein kinase RsbW
LSKGYSFWLNAKVFHLNSEFLKQFPVSKYLFSDGDQQLQSRTFVVKYRLSGTFVSNPSCAMALSEPMNSEKQTTTLHIPSVAESIHRIEKFIDSLRDEHKVNEECYGNMLVAVTEAVNNAIQHGNKYDASKQVEVLVEVESDQITFTIRDQGPGFDYLNLPDPTDPENLEKPAGRGVFLMKHLADQIIFSENGRVVELYFKTTGHIG